MKIYESINKFYDNIKLANKDLKDKTNTIENKKEEIKKIIDNLNYVESNIVVDENSSEIKKICKEQEEEYRKSVLSWSEKIKNYLETKEFVNQFEKSLLLMVFGDVKAGKSQLGNLISGYYFNNTEYSKLNTFPKFYRYDSRSKENNNLGKQELKENSFLVDTIEATSTIQYFTLLDGLSWVDTPGIHSLTLENQELANEYIKYADLILFLTPSNNPCKQDENNEIKRLIDANKPIILTITKSDVSKKAIIDGEPKTIITAKTTRKEQEEHLKNIIDSIGKGQSIQNNKYISISSELAKRAIEKNDEYMYEQSNLDEFLEQLSYVLSKKSIELKMRRPKDELNFVISELLNGDKEKNIYGIKDILENVSKILSEIQNQKNKLDNMKNNLIENINLDLITQIDTILKNSVDTGEISNKNILSEKVFSTIKDSVNKILNGKIVEILSDFKNYTINNYTINSEVNYEKRYETIEFEIYDIVDIERPPEGIIEHICQFIFDEKYTTSDIIKTSKSKQIEMGDNYNDVLFTYLEDVKIQVEKIVDIEMERIKKEYFKIMEELFSNILEKLENTILQLNNLKFKKEIE